MGTGQGPLDRRICLPSQEIAAVFTLYPLQKSQFSISCATLFLLLRSACLSYLCGALGRTVASCHLHNRLEQQVELPLTHHGDRILASKHRGRWHLNGLQLPVPVQRRPAPTAPAAVQLWSHGDLRLSTERPHGNNRLPRCHGSRKGRSHPGSSPAASVSRGLSSG